MSWTDTFPVLTEEMLTAYQDFATPEELEQLDGWLAVERILNPRESDHLVVTSLHRAPVRSQLANPDDGTGFSENSRTSWFELRSLLEGVAVLRSQKPDVVMRVYLSADLDYVTDQLTVAGCEVFLMRGTCTTNNPSAMWRFLALEEEGRWITITHGNFGNKIIHDVERTEQLAAPGLGAWRVPHLVGDKSQREEARSYRPIHSAHFGAKGGFPTGLLMRALIWHCQRGTMQLGCDEGDSRGYPLKGSEWTNDKPHEDFDHWFLLAALYPRLAFEGFLTFFIWQRKSLNCWYALDTEYVTWANPGSEILFTRKIVTPDSPWRNLAESNGLAIRSDTTVFRRRRRKVYEGSEDPEPNEEILSFSPFEGNLREMLDFICGKVETRWWVDSSPWLKSHPLGSEIFLDRRYDAVDVVACGSFFVKITRSISEWALSQDLDPAVWQEGWNCKLPKLEGPLTLWNTDFSRRFSAALHQQPDFITPEVLLLAWVRQGKAKVNYTTAIRMGWRLS